MKDPVDHIARPPLPWRAEAGQTECGLNAAKVVTITREEYAARRKDLGMVRCAMVTCMTCAQTAQRWESWETDPRKAVGREIEWETRWSRGERGEQLRDELLAIEQLITEHRDEFDQHLARIAARREWVDRKAKRRPASRPTRSKPL